MSAIQGVLDYLRNRGFRRFPADIVTGVAVLVGLVGLMAGLTAAAAAPSGHGSLVSDRSLHPTVTATTLTAGPSADQEPPGLVTLAATETAADGSHPAGYIQFEVGGTDVGGPIAVNSAGVATTTTAALSGVGAQSMSAAFTPMSPAYLTSATRTATTTVSGNSTSFVVPVSLTVPIGGYFTVTVIPRTVTLQRKGQVATGVLQQITVSESRNYSPGWSVFGQESDFIGRGPAAGQIIPGNQLGWVPTGIVSNQVKLGPAIEPGNPGLGTAGGVLAQAAAGQGLGTDTLSADLVLSIPSGTVAGPYTGSLTITYLEDGPVTPPPGFALPPPQNR